MSSKYGRLELTWWCSLTIQLCNYRGRCEQCNDSEAKRKMEEKENEPKPEVLSSVLIDSGA